MGGLGLPRRDTPLKGSGAEQRLRLAFLDDGESAMTGLIAREDHEGVAVLWLDRPERLNAMNAALRAELTEALRAAEADRGVIATVLAGRGRAFCAGQDLEEAATFQPEHASDWVTAQAALFQALRDSTKPTLAAWHGAAIGAGLQLGLCCDRRLAAAPLRLGQPEVAAGFASIFGSYFLSSFVGHAVNQRLSLGCELIEAEDARSLGLLDRIVPREALLEAALAEARRLAALPRTAYALTKTRFRDATQPGFDAAVAAARDAQAQAFGSGEIACALRERSARKPKSSTV
jgi:enoyl-CoA hydratase/carnithine racemase